MSHTAAVNHTGYTTYATRREQTSLSGKMKNLFSRSLAATSFCFNMASGNIDPATIELAKNETAH